MSLFLLLSPCIFAQPNDLNRESLAGRVKRIDEDEAVMKEKNGVWTEGTRNRRRTVIFDKQGRITYEWAKIRDLDPGEAYFDYEKDGRRISRRRVLATFPPGDKPLPERYGLSVFSFDKDKNILSEDVFIGDMHDRQIPSEMNIPTQKYKYFFDKDLRLLARVMLTLKGEEASRDTYVYGSQRLFTERRLSLFGNPRQQVIKYTYELDDQGNWTKQTEVNTLADAAGTTKTVVTYRKLSYYKN
jgi:hypothetical protein